jgi:hypothetical protein
MITYRGPMPPADEEEFLVAVAADPENDELRLELANHLRSYEPGLAQFITMQVTRVQGQRKRSNLDDDVPTADERRLLSGNAVAWSRAVAHYARQAGSDRSQLTFHRGLVARIGMDPRVFMERAPYLLKTTPVRHIDFTACTPATLERLLATEHLGRLDSIGFVDLGFDDDAIEAIAASPRLANCRYLDLSGNRLSARAFDAIAASPHLQQLLVLERRQYNGSDPARSMHPGEVKMVHRDGEGIRVWIGEINEHGHALLDQHGYLPWLYFRNRVSRFNARWAATHGHRPVRWPGQGAAIPAATVSVFDRALRESAGLKTALPPVLCLGQVSTVEGSDLRVKAGTDFAGNFYLDYVRETDDSTWHGRVHPDGRVEPLQNYQGQYGTRVLGTEEATEEERRRVAAHNEKVRKILRSKGFEDQPEPANLTNLPLCLGCQRPVLEISGQFTRLQPYLLRLPTEKHLLDTAGDWHEWCLEAASLGDGWHHARVRSLLKPGARPVAEVDGWTVLESSAEALAVSPAGAVLSLNFAWHRPTFGGLAGVIREPEMNLQLDADRMRVIQDTLERAGHYPLLSLADDLGIRYRLRHPELWRESGLRYDPELREFWSARHLTAALEYSVFVPDVLAPYARVG